MKNSPVFAPRGNRVLFVSDENGIDNLYIANIDSMEKARPITDYLGGCSNPDWSADSASVVFTLFQKQGWDVWLMDKPLEKFVADSLEKTKWVEAMRDTSRRYFALAPKIPDTARAATTSHKKKGESAKVAARSTGPAPIASPDAKSPDSAGAASPVKSSTAAPAATAQLSTKALVPAADSAHPSAPLSIPSPEPYRLKFSPDLVTLGLGASSYYGFAGQWLLSLSDIMGNHRITFAGDVQSDFSSAMHFFASYMYMKHRLNFGGGAYFYKDYTLGSDSVSLYYHDADLGGFLAASYPFSMFSRLDFQLYGRHITRTPFSPDGDTAAVRTSGGTYSVNSLLPSLSYSFDNILWGLTGPLNGSRAQASIEVSPPASFLNAPFISGEVDVRTYFHFLKRFVWANRVFLGASEPLSATPSVRRFFLGGNENWLFNSASDVNWHQYGINTRDAIFSDDVVPFRGWRYYDLTGTRAAVLNTEFRFPFIREISTVFPLPMAIRYINGALFADIGNAWDPGDQVAEGVPLPKKLYGGVGFGARADLGIFVLRYDRGWPVDVFRGEFLGGPIDYFSLGAEF